MTAVSAPTATRMWRMVIIDDSPDDRAEVRRLLLLGSERRYKFAEAETGAAGVRAVLDSAAGPPDCVVLDYNLPDMDALEVLEVLAGPDGMTACPVVVLTGTVGHEHTRAVLRAGAQDYLGKGWMTPESLTRAVENATERYGMARELRDRQAALGVSEERLKEAQRLARIGSWAWEPYTGRVWWSDALCDVFGVDRATVAPSYEAFLALVHPDDRGVAVARVDAVLAGADGFSDDLRLITPDGRLVWIHSQARAIRSPDGLILRVEGTDQDITGRKAAETALAASEARFRLAAAATHAMVYDLDVQAMRVNSLHGLEHLIGYAESEAEPTLDWWDARIDPRDLPMCRAAFGLIRATPCPQAIRYRVRHKDGRTLWVEDSVAPVLGADGKLHRLVGTVVDITVKKNAEDQLRRNHETFYHLVQNDPFGVYVIDSDFRLLQVSHGARKVFSAVRPLLGRDFADALRVLWSEPYAGEIEFRFRHTLATGEPYTAVSEGERRADTGEVAAYDWRIERVNLPDGRYGVVCYFYDLSERKRWEAVLQAKELELRSLTDNTPDILTRFDRGLRHVFVNAAVERATGRPRDEFLGKTNRELGMPADLCDRWEAGLRSVFENRGLTTIDFAFDGADGLRHYTSRLVPEFGPDGGVEFVLGVTHDVTDRKRAEQAVRESEERLARAQRAAGVGTWDWDILTGRAEWTAEAWELFGPASTEGPITYDFWMACVHPDDRESAAAATAAALAGGPYHDIFRVCRRDGSIVWLEAEGAIVRDADGRAVRLLGTVRNVTDRKLAEDALRVADRRKDEFLATLAHELRNPLAPIRNGLSVLRMARSPDQAQTVVGMMDRQLGHMVNLVDDLLDVSRVRTGKVTLRAERVTIREVVDAAVEACRPTIDEKSHTLVVALPAESPAVTGDKTRLVQVVANLLTNAAKYSEAGGRIRVTAAREGGEAGEAVIRVSDTGLGIAPHLLPTLWDLFTQVRDTLDKAQGGLGIGLSLVKKLVEMHGGSVAAESMGVGHGSTFTVRLPLAAAAEPATAPTPQANETTSTRSVGRRILVVDDNVDGAYSLAMMLGVMGNECRTANDGLAAVTVAETFRPDVILMDIGMPKLNGYDACRRIREKQWGEGIVMVAQTGWGQDDDKRQTQAAGFDFHMVKPVDPAALEEMLAGLPARTG